MPYCSTCHKWQGYEQIKYCCLALPKSLKQTYKWFERCPQAWEEGCTANEPYTSYRRLAEGGARWPDLVEGAFHASGSIWWSARLRDHIQSEASGMPWAGESWAASDELRCPHFQPGKGETVFYVANMLDGLRGRLTSIRAGRYLQKFHSGSLDARTIQEWAKAAIEAAAESEVKFATTPDEIERVYLTGPNSCMSHSAHSYTSDVHPVRVYGAGDLAVAYIENGGKPCARALCWPEKKLYSRVYGCSSRLGAALAKLDYQPGRLYGARLLKIESGDSYIMPFIDNERVVHAGDYFELSASGESAGRTDGMLEDNSTSCERCGDRISDPDDANSFRGEPWCDSCYSEHTTECEHCNEQARREDTTAVGEETWCDSCARDTTECSRCHARVADDSIAGQTRRGGSICQPCADEHYTQCEECERFYFDTRPHCPDCGPPECQSPECSESAVDGMPHCAVHLAEAQAAEAARLEAERVWVNGLRRMLVQRHRSDRGHLGRWRTHEDVWGWKARQWLAVIHEEGNGYHIVHLGTGLAARIGYSTLRLAMDAAMRLECAGGGLWAFASHDRGLWPASTQADLHRIVTAERVS